jgi:HEAT repeat protein
MTQGDIGIFTTDAALVVQSWGAWLEAATGIRSEAAEGRALGDLIPDLESRGILGRLRETLTSGTVQVFTPAFHHYVIPCPPRHSSRHFERMQQRVTAGPLVDGDTIIGAVVTVQDVTPQLDGERDIAEALASEDPERRRAAAEALAATRVESLDSFAPALRDDDWTIRRAAVHALARAADRDLLEAVLATLRREHRNFSTLSSALKLLAVTDIDITAPLARLLEDEDPGLRMQAALALGDQHDAAAVEALIGALDDPDANVRFHAIESLGRLRAEAALDALAEVLESRDFFLSFAALDAIALINDSRVAPRLVPLLADESLRPAVANALQSLGDEAVIDPLVRILNATPAAGLHVVAALVAISDRCQKRAGHPTHVATVVAEAISEPGRTHALAAIDQADERSLPPATRFLGWLRNDVRVTARLVSLVSDPVAREYAIEALVQHGDPAVDPLTQLLSSDDADVRDAAIRALARLGNRRATPALIALLPERPHTIAVAAALAHLGDPQAFEPLLTLIAHPDPAVRQGAIGALNSIGHPAMPERVIGLLHSPDAVARESAVRIAGYFGYRAAVDPILAAASDASEPVRVAALEHLPFVDDARVLSVLVAAVARDTPKARAAAARALARVEGDAAGQALLAATSDPDHWVRYFASRSLGERREREAVGRLVAVAEADPLPHVRIAALDAVGRVGDTTAVTHLARCAEDDEKDVAGAALRALGRLGAPDALATLRAAARADDPARRLAAVEALAAHGTPDAVGQLEWLAGGDPDTAVAAAAVVSLGEVAARAETGAVAAVDALVALCSDPARRAAAADVISGLPPSLIPHVARGLRHPQAPVRRRVVECLGRFLDQHATAFIAGALQDDAAIVRETAVAALARLGTRSCDEQLKRLADRDPSKAVRRAAAAALASMRQAG